MVDIGREISYKASVILDKCVLTEEWFYETYESALKSAEEMAKKYNGTPNVEEIVWGVD